MQTRQLVHLVRSGYALATPQDLEVMKRCPKLDILEEGWVPRWALEAKASLEGAGCPPEQLREIFSSGHDQIFAALAALVSEGKRARVIEPRIPYARQVIDRPTEVALLRALRHHTASCAACDASAPCLDADELRKELELLFPPDRRRNSRTTGDDDRTR